MKVSFFTAVVNIECAAIPAGQDQISHGLYITSDKDILHKLIEPPLLSSIGSLEVDFLKTAPAIIYSIDEMGEDFNWREHLNAKLSAVKGFLNLMWLLKDNAADCELGFLTYSWSDEHRVHSNALSSSYFKADGSRGLERFSREELRNARTLYRSLVGTVKIAMPDEPGVVGNKELGRLMRSLYWVQVARGTAMGERIASYCTAMESLMATSSSELG